MLLFNFKAGGCTFEGAWYLEFAFKVLHMEMYAIVMGFDNPVRRNVVNPFDF
jgi:hypothetical protein